MRRILDILAAVLLFQVSGHAQLQALFSNATAPQTAIISNSGQVGHFVYLQLSNAPSQICSPGGASTNASLEYSFDNSTWSAFGSPQSAIQDVGVVAQLYVGGGLFNYIRFNLRGFDTTNCRATAYYTGFTQLALQSVQGASPTGTKLEGGSLHFLSPLYTGGVGNGGKMVPIEACDRNISGSVTAGTSGVVQAGATNQLTYVCFIAVTLSANGTFKLQQAVAGGSCAGALDISPAFTVAANTPFVLGTGLGTVVRTTGVAFDLCLVATGGNATYFMGEAQY